MRSLALLVAVLSTGCASSHVPLPDDAPADLYFVTDASRYETGDEAHLTLTNGTDETYEMGVLGCTVLQRREGQEWVTSPEGNDRACIMMLQIFRPGDSEAATVPLDVAAGTYRFTHSLARADSNDEVLAATASFRVE